MTKLWFKSKKYGWGWYPATWQGWAILLVFVAIILEEAKRLGKSQTYFIETFVLVILLIIICYKTGEKPRWRWGK